jgi:N-ethylmaleimide reductase
MKSTDQPLLQPIKLGDLTLRNRVWMAPMTRSRAANSAKKVFELHDEYYRQRATAGLIITEGSQVSPQGVGYINTPGIYSEAQTEAWKSQKRSMRKVGIFSFSFGM